jgi:hypothetical protein
MKRQDKDVPGRKIDQGADIQAQTKITDNGQKITTKGKENELIKPDNLLSLGGSGVLVQPGIHNILIDRP